LPFPLFAAQLGLYVGVLALRDRAAMEANLAGVTAAASSVNEK
jgi:hypothetical protein